jgi:hypothetical protein
VEQTPEHLLGYRNNLRWRDMSEYLVHFTDSKHAFASILVEGLLRESGPYGWGRNIAEVAEAHRSACLSEIPLDLVDRLTARHGRWGMGFHRSFVIKNGGARVWYVDEGSSVATEIFERVGDLLRTQHFEDRYWKMLPFIDLVSPSRRYEFDWEREWRVPGGLTFTMSDVAFVVLPDGAAHEVVEELTVGQAAYYSHDDLAASFFANPEPVADAMDAMAASFLEEFDDPANHLPYDSGEGGYIWLVTEWDTGDAVDELFQPLEESVRDSLIDYLNGLSSAWVSRAEMASLAD